MDYFSGTDQVCAVHVKDKGGNPTKVQSLLSMFPSGFDGTSNHVVDRAYTHTYTTSIPNHMRGLYTLKFAIEARASPLHPHLFRLLLFGGFELVLPL